MNTFPLFIGDEDGLRDVQLIPRTTSNDYDGAEYDQAYGKEIKRRRLAIGVTQSELAYAIGSTNVMISRIENATARVTDTMRRRLEAGFKDLEGRA